MLQWIRNLINLWGLHKDSEWFEKNPAAQMRFEDLEDWIEDEIDEVCDKVDSQGASNKDIDSMDGIEYEQYCKTILENAVKKASRR